MEPNIDIDVEVSIFEAVARDILNYIIQSGVRCSMFDAAGADDRSQ